MPFFNRVQMAWLAVGTPLCFGAAYITKNGVPILTSAPAETDLAGHHALSVPAHISNGSRYKECVEILKQQQRQRGKGETLSRREQVRRIKEQYSDEKNPVDFLIVGGGATGSAAALEAAARGFSTVLVDAGDLASATSGKSTKLLHGGVRYLEKAVFQADPAQLGIVLESLRERETLMSMAPHLTWEQSILIPCYSRFELLWYRAGMFCYDLMGSLVGHNNFPSSRILGAEQTMRRVPAIRTRTPAEKEGDSHRLFGSVEYFDGSFNDARMAVSMALTAQALGAVVANYMTVVKLITSQGGSVCGARLRDEVSGESATVYARCVINATGPASDSIRKMLVCDGGGGGDGDDENKQQPQQQSTTASFPCIQPSRGTHISLPPLTSGAAGGHQSAILIPKTPDGRVMFIEPWLGDTTIAGTTDDPCERPSLVEKKGKKGAAAAGSPTKSEADWILRNVKSVLYVPSFDDSAILSAWSGIRPLAVDPREQQQKRRKGSSSKSSSSSSSSTEDLVRNALVFSDSPGFVSVVGGKWTNVNAMAVETVDQAMSHLPERKSSSGKGMPAMSKYLRLIGSQSPLLTKAQLQLLCSEAVAKLSAKYQSSASSSSSSLPSGCYNQQTVAAHLVSSYGDRAFSVLDICKQQQQQQQQQQHEKDKGTFVSLFDVVAPGSSVLLAEAVYAARHELAVSPTDFLARRSRAALLDSRSLLQNDSAVRRVAAVMAKELGENDSWVNSQVQRTMAELKEEFSVSQ